MFERVGEERGTIPSGYFDCVYTVSTLEHIPPNNMKKVFAHMCKILKPGGRMLHCVDVPMPLGIHNNINIKGLCLGTGGYWLYHKTKELTQSLERPYLKTINGWWRFLKQYFGPSLNITCKGPSGYISTVLNTDVVKESPDVVYKFYPPNEKAKSYKPSGTFIFILEKQQGANSK